MVEMKTKQLMLSDSDVHKENSCKSFHINDSSNMYVNKLYNEYMILSKSFTTANRLCNRNRKYKYFHPCKSMLHVNIETGER